MLDPLINSIEVPCDQQKAFTIFIEQMTTWWPLDKFTTSAMGGAPAKEIRVDARAGGAIIEVGADDTETLYGNIEAYDPYGFLSMWFHFGPPGVEITERTLVELTFETIDANNTRVELRQSNWEALGDMAADIRGGYEFGWKMIFEQGYAAACSG
ncbi:SRPBCC domain-containing protein [Candidatus Halocynthiibacter alkanivorans]|uniref:SRPBCC domain-containing protein n=1 Tax=Candidatus Halocynthiibacter alkanivorans TaxID=2267619 RepID=UPI000DF2E68C|nr:SRPBCC domain-containing protein [Candidatus Halocynthiibacter alkanivorans]